MANRDEHLLTKAVDWVTAEHKEQLIDALHCVLFNQAGELEGNTEANDVRWLAQRLWQVHTWKAPGLWEQLPASEQERWIVEARTALSVLPALIDRIAARCRVQAAVLRSLLAYERAERQRQRKEQADG